MLGGEEGSGSASERRSVLCPVKSTPFSGKKEGKQDAVAEEERSLV